MDVEMHDDPSIPSSVAAEKILDLNDDLNQALTGNFEFTGKYYFNRTDPVAPNPGLKIDGIGTVGLPLSDRDAQLIISRASQAPFGKGSEAIVDTAVRDTWEIDGRNIECANPLWTRYANELAFQTIWSALGVAPWSSPPQLQLYKLLLYQTDSHFLPHQDTYKEDGMFATVATVIDISQDSEFGTSVLACYTDVFHQVKPILSGYRLALSYNLCQTAPKVPRPRLPDMNDAVTKFRNVLTKWRDGVYPLTHSPPILAYVLSHQYMASDLTQGLERLKGADAHKVVHLVPSAKELGFSVCLANVTFEQSGQGPGTDEEVTGPIPPMDYLETESFGISNFVPVECAVSAVAQVKRFQISKDCLVPKDHFEGKPPNRLEYEDFRGNEPGDLEFWYDRSVLILFRNEGEIGVLVGLEGIEWAIDELRRDPEPSSSYTKAVMAAILCHLKFGPKEGSRNEAPLLELMQYPFQWKDSDLWNEIFPCYVPLPRPSPTILAAMVKLAVEVFGLASIQLAIENGMKQVQKLRTTKEIINAIATNLGDEATPEWKDALMETAVRSYTTGAYRGDLHVLIEFARKPGALETIQTILIPNMSSKVGSHSFLSELAREFNRCRSQFPEVASSGSDSDSALGDSDGSPRLVVDDVIRLCLEGAVEQYGSIMAGQGPTGLHSLGNYTEPFRCPSSRFDWICDMLELCVDLTQLGPCETLFSNVLKGPDGIDPSNMFEEIYKPLVYHLKDNLKWTGDRKKWTSQPLAGFFKELILRSIEHIMGSTESLLPFDLAPLGCGCSNCEALDAWVNDMESFDTFRLQTMREWLAHLQSQLAGTEDFFKFSWNEYSSQPTLVIKKRPNQFVQYSWKARQMVAWAFLGEFEGSYGLSELREIMGDKFGDMKSVVGEFEG